jgi:hypothetical protein
MTLPLGVNVFAIVLAFAAGAGAMWLYMLASQSALRERERAGATELARTYRWLRDKDERLATLAGECEALRISNAEWHAASVAEKESFERERSVYDGDRKALEETFRSIGKQILDGNTQQLVDLSRAMLDSQLRAAKEELDLKRDGIEGLVALVGQTLIKLEEQFTAIEHAREGDREALKSGLELLGQLVTAWRATTQESASIAGVRPAELAVKRHLEPAGMLAPGPKAFENPSVVDIGAMLREYSSPTARFVVRFRYPDENGKTVSEREVEPYGVIERSGTPVLLGFDRGRKAWRTFEINKFSSKPVRALRCVVVRNVPDQYKTADVDGVFKNGKQDEIAAALTSSDGVLPRHADGGKPVNTPPASVAR